MTSQNARRVTEETKIIGMNILRLRRSFGYSQEQVATALGVTFQQVQKYEKGESRLSAEKLFLLKNFLGVPYAAFFFGLPTKPDVLSYESFTRQIARNIKTLSDTEANRKVLGLVMVLLSEL